MSLQKDLREFIELLSSRGVECIVTMLARPKILYRSLGK